MNLVKKHAALMVKDNEAKEKLVAAVIGLAKNEELQEQLKQHIAPLAITNADEVNCKRNIEYDKVISIHNIKRIYFIGIGGIGMSALARVF